MTPSRWSWAALAVIAAVFGWAARTFPPQPALLSEAFALPAPSPWPTEVHAVLAVLLVLFVLLAVWPEKRR